MKINREFERLIKEMEVENAKNTAADKAEIHTKKMVDGYKTKSSRTFLTGSPGHGMSYHCGRKSK